MKDYCYRKVKKQYKVFPSAYASGAIVRCRRRLGVNRFSLEKKYGLHGWFMRGDGKGWIDCKTGKPCGRKKGEKRKYPACRPTKAMCSSAMRKKRGRRRISWVRKNPNDEISFSYKGRTYSIRFSQPNNYPIIKGLRTYVDRIS